MLSQKVKKRIDEEAGALSVLSLATMQRQRTYSMMYCSRPAEIRPSKVQLEVRVGRHCEGTFRGKTILQGLGMVQLLLLTWIF